MLISAPGWWSETARNFHCRNRVFVLDRDPDSSSIKLPARTDSTPFAFSNEVDVLASSTMQLTEQGPMLVGVLWMEVIICFIILCLRVYTRTIIRSNMGLDDLLLIVTWVCFFFSEPIVALLLTDVGFDGRLHGSLHRRCTPWNGCAHVEPDHG